MSKLATAEFLDHLKSIYPSPQASTSDAVISNPWYLVAAVTFSASNNPKDVVSVFKYALADLKSVQKSNDDGSIKEQLQLARRIREAILQSGLLSGMPRVIYNSAPCFSLYEQSLCFIDDQ